jgi:hypothetical protein
MKLDRDLFFSLARAGYYAGRVPPRRGEDTEHNTNGNAGAADQQNREQSFFAKW